MTLRGSLLSQVLLVSMFMFLAAAASPAQEAAEAELLARAQQKLEACDFEGAIADCGEALRRNPANCEALYLRAQARLWNGDRFGATEDCGALLASDVAGDARSCFRRGCAREMTRDYRTALAEFTRAISLAPADLEAYLGRLRTLTRASDYKGMARDADTVIALTSEAIDAGAADGRMYRWRGFARTLRGQTEDASADFVKALELNPRDVWSWMGLARTKQLMSDTEGALNDASQAVSLAPRLAEAYVRRGHIRGGANDVDGLLADMSTAIELDPTERMAYVFRGQTLLLRGESAAALADARKLLELDPQDSDGYVIHGLVKKAADDSEGARQDFLKALELSENSFEKYYRAAEQVKGAYNDKMIALATEALALNPRNDHAYEGRAQAKARTKDLSGAIADMDEAIAIRPDQPQYYYLRGAYRKLSGDDAGAQADLDNARQLAPDSDLPAYPEPPAIPVAVMGFAAFLSAVCFLIMGLFTVMAHISLTKKRRDVGQWQFTQPQLEQLPATIACETDVKNGRDVKRVAMIVGGIGVALSSVNGILYLAGMYGDGASAPWSFPPANPVTLALLALLCYFTGVRAERAIRRLVITPDDVTLITPRKQGDEQWTESLSNYRGLLGKTAVYSRKGSDNDEYYLELELLHDDPDKTFRVYRKKGSMDSVPKNESMTGRALWKTYAGLLGVDALEQHERDIVVHEVEDLGKSARELVREGKIDAPLDPAGPVPPGITIRADNGETIVTIDPGRNFDLMVVRGMGIALGVMMSLNFVLGGGGRSLPFALAGVAMIIYALWYKQPHTRLRITRDSLRVQSVTPRRETTVAAVDTASIEDVRLETVNALQLSLEDAFAKMRNKPGAPSPIRKAGYLSLVTDTKTVAVPAARSKLPLETAEWLRSFILRMIAADQPPQPADHSEATL